MNFLDFSNLSDDSLIASAIDLQDYFTSCEEIGQGISTKESVKMNALKAEIAKRGIDFSRYY